MTRISSTSGRLAIAVIASGILAGSAFAWRGAGSSASRSRAAATVATTAAKAQARPLTPAAAHALRVLRVPAALTSALLSLRAGPVPVPMVLEIPSIGVHAPMIGVGVTPGNVMDAPEGPRGDPVWQQAFWYHGSAVPGVRSTTLIAGHIDGPLGSTAVFGNIKNLKPGATIVLHDQRTGLDVRYAVTQSVIYTLAQTTQASVLTRMYGSGPVAGKRPQHSVDGRAHLTLVTCAGTFEDGLGTHDHRLAVYAVRIA